MKLFTKHIAILVTALVLMVVSFATGVMTTINFLPDEYKANIFSNNNNSETIVQEGVDMTAFWKTWNKIEELYIGDMPTKEEKAWGAIQGLVSSLDDPYSVFFPPRESERFESGIRGDFEGGWNGNRDTRQNIDSSNSTKRHSSRSCWNTAWRQDNKNRRHDNSRYADWAMLLT